MGTGGSRHTSGQLSSNIGVKLSSMSVPPPECTIVKTCDLIYASVTTQFTSGRFSSGGDENSMGDSVAPMLSTVADTLAKYALQQQCNCVYGVQMNVTNDSSGERGNFKNVIVTMIGNPCQVTGPNVPKVSDLLRRNPDFLPNKPGAIRKVQFKPGPIGLKAVWGTGIVGKTDTQLGQAKELGVEENWQMVAVNGEPYTEKVLDYAIAQQKGVEIAFGITEVDTSLPERLQREGL